MIYFIIGLVLLGFIVIYISLPSDKNEEKQIDYKSFDIYKGLRNLDIKNDKIIKLKQEVQKYIIGTDELINSIIVAIFANGHILVEGVPGLAKTRTILVFSKILGLDFKRVQFTPDMLPSDIIGGEIYNKNTGKFEIFKGPIFTNLLLADEINRATPKVQSALLEAMQERKVTIGNETFQLNLPFFVMATQNPLEQEGTFPLPEAQLDRFLFKVNVGYPTKEEEKKVMNVFDKNIENIENIFNNEEIIKLQKEVENIVVNEEVKNYIVDIVDSTRNNENFLVGASTRAVIAMKKTAMVVAFLQGKSEVDIDDVKKIVLLVLRHRVKVNPKLLRSNKTVDEIIMDNVLKINDFTV